MQSSANSICPGCGLEMPLAATGAKHAYINSSAECWGVYGEVLAFEYGNAIAFGQVHQLTVDAYAAQHPGRTHPDKSIAVHLAGLHAAFELGWPQIRLPLLRQRLSDKVKDWPHFPPPDEMGDITVWDVALADSLEDHVTRVRQWSDVVWQCWRAHHREIADFVESHTTGT